MPLTGFYSVAVVVIAVGVVVAIVVVVAGFFFVVFFALFLYDVRNVLPCIKMCLCKTKKRKTARGGIGHNAIFHNRDPTPVL